MDRQMHNWNVTTDETGSESAECPQKDEYSVLSSKRPKVVSAEIEISAMPAKTETGVFPFWKK
jgi:hypothetical protein